MACSVILLWSDSNISSPVKNSRLSILPDDNADIADIDIANDNADFAASLLILYCTFSSLILSSIFMISFYTLSKIFFFKREELSDARVV